MNTLYSLINKIENRISEYIEFDVRELFKQGDYITIYGGAVRDSIADMPINDVDIICLSHSATSLAGFIKKLGYKKTDLVDKEAFEMYRDISLINDPWTFINSNGKIIQIIRPSVSFKGNEDYITKDYLNIIKNVDITSCGVFIKATNDYFNDFEDKYQSKIKSYNKEHLINISCDDDVEIVLKEASLNSIFNCLTRTFQVNKNAILYNSLRTEIRKHKLEDRGWKDIDSLNVKEKTLIDRQLKLFNLDFKYEYNYKIWSEDEFKYLNVASEQIGLPF